MTAWYEIALYLLLEYFSWQYSILTKLLKIPLCDNLLQIEMPKTPLTEILNDFRSYRPGNHRG